MSNAYLTGLFVILAIVGSVAISGCKSTLSEENQRTQDQLQLQSEALQTSLAAMNQHVADLKSQFAEALSNVEKAKLEGEPEDVAAMAALAASIQETLSDARIEAAQQESEIERLDDEMRQLKVDDWGEKTGGFLNFLQVALGGAAGGGVISGLLQKLLPSRAGKIVGELEKSNSYVRGYIRSLEAKLREVGQPVPQGYYPQPMPAPQAYYPPPTPPAFDDDEDGFGLE